LPEPPADPTSSAWVLSTTTAISRGDRAALAAFYEVWFDPCYAIARSITARDESFCLDIVQDTMLRVIRSLKPIASHGELSAWMMRTTHSAALDPLRRESRRLRREAARGNTPSDCTQATDDRIAWLVNRLKNMPDGALVALRVGQERSLNAVGAAADMTPDAAHGKIRRALARLTRWAKENDRDR